MSKSQSHKGGKPVRKPAQKPKGAVQKKVQKAAGGSPRTDEKSSMPKRPVEPPVGGDRMLTWNDLKEHIESMDEDQLLELVEAVISGKERAFLVEDVRKRVGEAPVIELVSDDAEGEEPDECEGQADELF
jgi:hypothetical protein